MSKFPRPWHQDGCNLLLEFGKGTNLDRKASRSIYAFLAVHICLEYVGWIVCKVHQCPLVDRPVMKDKSAERIKNRMPHLISYPGACKIGYTDMEIGIRRQILEIIIFSPSETPVTTSQTPPFRSNSMRMLSSFEDGFSRSSCRTPISISVVVEGRACVRTMVSADRILGRLLQLHERKYIPPMTRSGASSGVSALALWRYEYFQG